MFKGVCRTLRGPSSPLAAAYSLESTALLRKYCGVLDMFVVLPILRLLQLEAKGMMALVNVRPWRVHAAMVAHASQYVWYRRLFVVFSRYTFLNTITKIQLAA